MFVAVLALQLLGQVRHSASNFKIVFLGIIVFGACVIVGYLHNLI